MSDYRNSRDPLDRGPNDPAGPMGYEPADGRTNAGWGWIAGAVFLVIVLALAFGVGHDSNSRVASNNAAPSAITHPGMTHPLGAPATTNRAIPPAAPGLTPPPAPAPAPTPSGPNAAH